MESTTVKTDTGSEKTINHYLQWARIGKTGILRYLIGAFLVLAISLVFGQVFSAVGATLIKSESPAATIVKTTFFGFIVSFLLLPIVAHLLHRRPWWSIAMPVKKFDLGRFAIGLATVLIVHLGLSLFAYFSHPEAFQYKGADWQTWIPMLLISFVIFFVQAGTEEMVYRGYLAQFVARYTGNPLLILLIPAIIFSAPHYGNIQGFSGIGALAPYIVHGMVYGWLAFRSGSLWMPLGAHLVNNWFITMFLGSGKENIEKVSLFLTSGEDMTPGKMVLETALYALLVIGIAEFLMRRTKKVVPFQRLQEDVS